MRVAGLVVGSGCRGLDLIDIVWDSFAEFCGVLGGMLLGHKKSNFGYPIQFRGSEFRVLLVLGLGGR